MKEESIQRQIIKRGVTDPRIVEAFKKVPREEFIPISRKHMAEFDSPISIDFGQTISQPYIVAYMVDLLKLKGDETILELGTGSGFQTAILAELCQTVYSIERISELQINAKTILKKLGYSNVFFQTGDGYWGWKGETSFDRIIVSAAVKEIPIPLIDQLKIGGIMVVPVKTVLGGQELQIVNKLETSVEFKNDLAVRFVPFISDEF